MVSSLYLKLLGQLMHRNSVSGTWCTPTRNTRGRISRRETILLRNLEARTGYFVVILVCRTWFIETEPITRFKRSSPRPVIRRLARYNGGNSRLGHSLRYRTYWTKAAFQITQAPSLLFQALR